MGNRHDTCRSVLRNELAYWRMKGDLAAWLHFGPKPLT